jgi:hypothetical protein
MFNENALFMFVTSPTSQSGIAPNPLATPYEVHRPSTAAASLSPRQLEIAVENVASVSATLPLASVFSMDIAMDTSVKIIFAFSV